MFALALERRGKAQKLVLGNAVRRDPVTYSSIAAGDSAPSMSMEESLSCILRGSSGSVRRSIQQTVLSLIHI